jgi:hypothetical protein
MRDAWVPMGCANSLLTMVAHFQLSEVSWYLIEAHEAARLAPGSTDLSQLAGTFLVGAEYSGCPGCRADSFVRCNNCGSLSCWLSSDQRFKCASCQLTGLVSGRVDSVRLSDWA